MLTLTRTPGEYLVLTVGNATIRIGVASVASFKGKLPAAKVRLCIDAPSSVRVLREELLTRPGGES